MKPSRRHRCGLGPLALLLSAWVGLMAAETSAPTGPKDALATGAAADSDWPSYRGPERNGVSHDANWSWRWGTNGPRPLWQATVGAGFSSFAAVGDRVYTMGNAQGEDSVFCLAAETGQVRWRHRYPCDPQPLSYEGGPGATPAVDHERVYTFSKDGHFFCLDAENGRVVWSHKFDLWPFQEGDWRNTWRYAGSPLVLGNQVFLSLGRAGAAFDKLNGKTLWQSPAGHPGYSSPVPFRTGRRQALAFFSGRSVSGVEADSGRLLWEVPWRTLWDLNAADPVLHDGQMFVSSGNGVGGAVYDLSVQPPRELWRNRNLATTLNSAVLFRDHLFGFNDTHLSCVSWATGEEKWYTRDVRKGSLLRASDKLILLSETGKLVVAEADPTGYRPLASAQVLEGRCWTTPVLARGRLLVRNAAGEVICLDLRRDPSPGGAEGDRRP